MELGRPRDGVPFGDSFGVDDALSTLAFLEPDRGVTFELKKAFTGVTVSSFERPFRPITEAHVSFRPSL